MALVQEKYVKYIQQLPGDKLIQHTNVNSLFFLMSGKKQEPMNKAADVNSVSTRGYQLMKVC